MKNLLQILFIGSALSTPQLLLAAEVSFSVAPNTVSGDGAVIIEAMLIGESEDGGPLNALEGRIGLFSDDAEAVTDVVIETGDSVFDFWPVAPTYDAEEQIIRFTGGTAEAFVGEERIFRIRLFTKENTPLTFSWLGGSAYLGDGLGTSIGIASRSLTVTPKASAPNLINSASVDTTPPQIESAIITTDPDVFEGQRFLSLHATDDKTGISHYEVVEGGITSRVENGPYVLRDQNTNEQLLVIVYDKAGNSVSVKIPEARAYNYIALLGLVSVVICWLAYRWLRKKRR